MSAKTGSKIGIVLGLGLVLLGAQVVLWYVVFKPGAGVSEPEPAFWRRIGSKLSSVGVKEEAARYYIRYLDHADVPPDTRAQVCLAIAQSLKQAGKLEEALGYLYQVEELAPHTNAAREAGALVVEVLDRLGLSQAAQTALSKRSSLDHKDTEASDAGPVVAKIGDRIVTRAELDEAMADLPPQVRSQLQQGDALKAFLSQYVAQELLYDKAVKRGLDKDPAVRRQVDQLQKQVVVNRLIEEQLKDKVRADEQDLRNYFQAHIDAFTPKGGKAPAFEDVKDKVIQAYLNDKAQTLGQALLNEAMAAQEVQIYPDALSGKSDRNGTGGSR